MSMRIPEARTPDEASTVRVIRRLFLSCLLATLLSLAVIGLGPDSGLEALGGVLVAYFALLFHLAAGLVIAIQAYRIRLFDWMMAVLSVYFLVIYGLGAYAFIVTTDLDDAALEILDAQRDPVGFELREIAQGLYRDQLGDRPVDAGRVDRMVRLLDRLEDIDGHEAAHRPVLWYAAGIGHEKLVETILERGASVDDPALYPTSPLVEAVRRGHRAVAELLLDRGANPNAVDQRDAPALVLATENDDLAMIDLLIEAGADVDLGSQNGTAFTVAMRQGALPIVARLLEHGATPTLVRGRHPIAFALEKDDADMLQLLGGESGVLDERIGDRDPPILRSFIACELDRVKRLLELGASPDVVSRRGTPLALDMLRTKFRSCEMDSMRPELFSMLIDNGLDLSTTDERGSPLVLVALHSRRLPEARRLIAAGAPIAGSFGNKGFLALAARNGANDLLDFGLEAGLDVNEWPSGLNTSSPLYEAVDQGMLETVRYLFERGATWPDEEIRIHNLYRAAAKHPSVLRALLERYAETGRSELHDRAVSRGVRSRDNPESLALLEELGIR